MRLGDYFKQAITKGDWEQICSVYTRITGEKIAPPAQKVIKLADIDMDVGEANNKQEVPLSDVEMDDDDNDDEPAIEMVEELPPEPKKTDDFAVIRDDDNKRPGRKEEIKILKARKNRFTDNLSIKADELVTVRPELGVKDPRPRGNRDMLDGDEATAANTGLKVDVCCSLCGKKECVSASLAIGWSKSKDNNTYKCNDCQTGKGRLKLIRESRNK